jgi:carboxymethylenebutenolidase
MTASMIDHRRRAILTLLAWLAMIGFDFLLHAGLLARLYLEPSRFLLPPERAFALIPLGYASFLLLAVALVWLTPPLGVRGALRGAVFGLEFGALVWGALLLGLASISTAPPALLVAWFIGQSVELGIGGAVVGSAIAGTRTKTLAIRVGLFVLGALLLTVAMQSLGLAPAARVFPARARGQASGGADTVVVRSGALRLHALLWRPGGRGPFPAILFNHGSGNTPERQFAQAAAIGPVFARHGYVVLFVFRRGSGLSADQGTSAADLMDRELAEHGQEARNRLQLKLLEADQLSDALAGLTFLRALPEVDTRRVGVAGHSFGGSLTLLVAERDTAIRAAVAFSGSAGSWEHSPELRARLLAAAGRATAPIFFIQAANDYSIAPAESLSAEMARLGKPHRMKIYPPVGRTAAEGHEFVYRSVDAWESDVFSFLDECMRR